MSISLIATLVSVAIAVVAAVLTTRVVRSFKKLEADEKKASLGVFNSGHSWPPRTPVWEINGVRVTSLEHFKELTGCDDELLAMLKLKYGEINSE